MQKNKKLVAPSLLSADFSKLGEEVKAIDVGGADWIHIDVMDGHFVPNLTMGPVVVECLRKTTSLPFDVHLMIEKPELSLHNYIKAGANIVTVHQEACVHLHRTVTMIQEAGARAGVSINPATSAERLTEILPFVDLVLVMSVNPGFGGQKFIKESIEKVKKLTRWRKERKLNFLIEVDGGVSERNAHALGKAGCDVFVAGSAVFGASKYSEAIKKIREKASNRG